MSLESIDLVLLKNMMIDYQKKKSKKIESKETERKKTRLRTCIFSNIILVSCVAIVIYLFSDRTSNRYLRWGPHDDLNLMGVKIDTWNRYLLLQVFLAFVQIRV